MPALFAVTLFVSATLLFLVQPMIAKIILPRFGGAPAVWNTCMVFFQAALLGGYLYAHLTTTRLGVRRQAVLHLGLLLLPLLFLPLRVPDGWTPPADANPIPWLLAVLGLAVGVPFFVVATSAPLLQRWFAATGHPSARDPYFLYAASNLGSMIALLGYPTLVEPMLSLPSQCWFWAAGYLLLLPLTVACAVQVWRAPVPRELPIPDAKDTAAGPDRWLRLRWVAWAFVPSSLMLGATTYLSTDLAPFPLLWVVPLAIYLLSFILVFARLPGWVQPFLVRVLPISLLALLFSMITGVPASILGQVAVHLVGLFVASMVFHGELARTRPAPRYLTEFYLWMSIGGVLGGLFNGLVAPLMFNAVYEYPLAVVLAGLLLPVRRPATARPWSRLVDVALPLFLGLVGLRLAFQWDDPGSDDLLNWVGEVTSTGKYRQDKNILRAALSWCLPVFVCYFFARRPLRFGLGVLTLYAANVLYQAWHLQPAFQERNFFGVVRVQSMLDGEVAVLYHGTTLHGAQRRHPNREIRMLPLTYFFPTGPVGQVFGSRPTSTAPVAVTGLGAGTLAAYGNPGQEFVFFEIDPAVVQVARDPQYFTYLTDSPATIRVVLGDARLKLEEEPDGHFGMIFVDAFSSDAVPVHLITREAMQLYLRKLAPGGLILVNISNKHLDLAPVMGNLARAEGLVGLVQRESERPLSTTEQSAGKLVSDWVVLARKEEDLGSLAKDPRWQRLRSQPGASVWTDDFSNVLSVIQWSRH